MGWFSSSQPAETNQASDGGRIAPDRSSRQKCWIGRDKFFACLDNNDIVDSLKGDKEARKKCAAEIAEFEGACSAAWAKYFKEKRVMEYNRDKTIERIKSEDAATRKDLKSTGWTSK